VGNILVHVAAAPQIVLLYKCWCVLRARQRTQNTPTLVLQLVVAAGDPPVRDYCLTVLSKTSQIRFFYDILAAWVMLPRICGEMQAGICSINKGWNEETGVKEDTPT